MTAHFPFNMLQFDIMPGPVGECMTKLRPYVTVPTYPWCHWTYARVFGERGTGLPGDFIELGVARGGTSLFFAFLARKWKKKVLSLDSFEGLPAPDSIRDNPYFLEGFYRSAASEPVSVYDRFRRAIREFEAEEIIVPMKGFFKDTLPCISADQKYCFAHIDCDLYESVHLALSHVYDRTVDGGVIVIDDFFHPAQGPLRAASDFFNARSVYPLYHVAFPYTVFVIKGEGREGAPSRSLDGNFYSLEWMRRDAYFIAILEKFHETSKGEGQPPRARENAERLLRLLASREPRSSDIYEYWRCLEDYWDCICLSPDLFRQVTPVLEI